MRQVATILTPDTILRWHRQLIARKWTFEPKRAGRPGIRPEISSLIVRLATEKPAWGSTRIRGALKNLGPGVARSTIATVLKHHGLSPAPDRPSSWRTFLRSPWGQIAGADFFTSEVWTPRGLVTYSTRFVIDLRSRQGHVAGPTPTPDAGFMAQVARRLTDAVDGFLAGPRFLICDRDSKWTEGFRRIIQDAGVQIVLPPVRRRMPMPTPSASYARSGRSVWTAVCHECRTEKGGNAAEEMRAAPSEPGCRTRLQTPSRGVGQEPAW